jgi:hypothetical protein
VQQNSVRRQLNVLVAIDSDLPVVETWAFRAGFELEQFSGNVPESILIGISAMAFALAGDLNQRTYELTWQPPIQNVTQNCGAPYARAGQVLPAFCLMHDVF